MRKFLIYFCAILCVGCASVGTQSEGPGIFVRVEGTGSNKDSAVDNALKNAVRKAQGVVIASQMEAQGDRLVQDQILDYSAGFVLSHQVISENTLANGRTRVELTAVVSSSKLAQRLLGRGLDQKPINGQAQQIYGQVSTVLRERAAGDALLLSLIKDYPKNSFVVKLGTPLPKIDPDRNTTLSVPVTITWAPGYLESLQETVKYVSVDRCWIISQTNSNYRCDTTVKFSNGLFDLGKLRGYKLPDNRQLDLVKSGYPQTVALELEIVSIQGDKYYNCYTLDLNVTNTPNMNRLVSQNYSDGSLEFFDHSYFTRISIPIQNINAVRDFQTIRAGVARSCR